MFGAFRPSAPLSGGLLWKIPWRMSSPQKLRHRRRMRRVDNVVSILSTALTRKYKQTLSPAQSASSTASHPQDGTPPTKATVAELETTAEGQRVLSSIPQSQLDRRHGKGPKQGDYLPGSDQTKLLSDFAREQGTIRLLERWKAEMPREEAMLPRDKYTMFDRKEKRYRKSVHKLPKWTRVSQRLNPPGF